MRLKSVCTRVSFVILMTFCFVVEYAYMLNIAERIGCLIFICARDLDMSTNPSERRDIYRPPLERYRRLKDQ